MNQFEPTNNKQSSSHLAGIDLDAILATPVEFSAEQHAKNLEAKKQMEESYSYNEGGRVVDTSTAKVLAKDRTEHEKGVIKALLERIKKGF